MTETDSTPRGDVANALVAQLESEAHLVDIGHFTLDPRKAREKLAAHQLAEPERYVLFLVEAAHLLPGCTSVAFTIERGATRVRFEGVELHIDELQGSFDALFVDVAGLDAESARRIRGRQRLALAINTALGLPRARVQTDTQRSTSSTSALVVEIHHAAASWRKQRAALRRDACYATVPLHLDGVRIADRSTDLCDAIEIRDAAGQIIGRAGWSATQTRKDSAAIAWIANGVIIETYPELFLPSGALVLLDATDLARDLSHSKLQRDETFHRRVEALTPACRALSQPEPTLGPAFPWVTALVWSVLCGVVALVLLGAAIAIWLQGESTRVGVLAFGFGLVLAVRMIWLIRDVRRYHHLRTNGRASLAVVESSSSTQAGSLREVTVSLSIERPGQDNYTVVLNTRVSDSVSLEAQIRPGKRVYVRIAPNDPQQVVFDSGE
jgi:hypothetical protein